MAERDPTHDTTKDWTWIDTPDPAQDILAVFVETQLITHDHEDENGAEVAGNCPKREILALGERPYSAPTRFNELAANFALPNLNHLGVATWFFIGKKKVDAKFTALYFFQDKTPEQLAIPYDFVSETGNHYWPAVLKEVFSDIDYSVTQSYNVITDVGTGNDAVPTQGIRTAPVVTIEDVLIAAIKEGSTIITEKYLSATQPPPRYDAVPQPQPMTVRVNGQTKQYDEILHDDMRFAGTPSGTREFLTNGDATYVGGAVGEQFFPRTGKFIDWRQYVVARSPVRNEYGLWDTTVIKVRPPKRRTRQN